MINKSVIVGRLVKDPEIRHTQSDKTVASFTVAVNRSFNKDEADFIPVVAWNKTAELIEQYVSKGDMVGISGRLQTRSYEAQDGTKRFVMELIAEEVQFISTNKTKTAESSTENQKTKQTASSAAQALFDDGFEEITDLDLPF